MNLLSINEFSKEDFDWFNNLHLNYTPGLNTEENTQTTTTTLVNDQEQLIIENNNINQDWLKTSLAPKTSCKKIDKPIKLTKEKTIKTHLKKNIKSTTSSTTATATLNDNNQQQNNNKKLLIKRSRKRTKPIVIQTPSPLSNQKNLNNSSHDDDIIETFEKKSELEPLNKKIAIDNSLNSKNVDLQIEQFSLLDLHSSEDDSELLIKTYNPKKIQNLEYSQNEIAKRTRYSSSESDTRIKINEQQQQQHQQQQSQVPKTSQKDINKLIELLKEPSSLSPPSSTSSCSIITNNNMTTASDTNNSSNESNDFLTNKNSKRKKLVQNRTFKQPSMLHGDEFNLNNFKCLDINSDTEITNFINENSQMTTISSCSSSSAGGPPRQERQKLWNNVKKIFLKLNSNLI